MIYKIQVKFIFTLDKSYSVKLYLWHAEDVMLSSRVSYMYICEIICGICIGSFSYIHTLLFYPIFMTANLIGFTRHQIRDAWHVTGGLNIRTYPNKNTDNSVIPFEPELMSLS